MKAIVKRVVEMVPRLNHDELHSLEIALEGVGEYEKVRRIIEANLEHDRVCPHCTSHNVYRHGKAAGLQRYRCNECHRTFNALTHTPLARLRKKELWLRHLELMSKSTVLRKEAEMLGIDLKTAFSWRHRFAASMGKSSPEQLEGIIEVDETYFQQSQKGNNQLSRPPHKRGKAEIKDVPVCVFSARDRATNTVECVAGTGHLKEAWVQENMNERLRSDVVLVSDGARAYEGFAKAHELKHVIVKSKPSVRVKGAFHIKNITAHHALLKEWVNGHFHGVATKYLNHYVCWLHEIEKVHRKSSSDLLRVAIGGIQHEIPT